eukprot:g27244.t1
MRIVVGASPSVTNTKGVGINTLGERFDVAQVGTWTEQPRAWRRGAAVKESSSSSSSSSSESSDGEGLEEQVRPKRSFAEWQKQILGDDDDDDAAEDAPDLTRSSGPSDHELTETELQQVAEQEQLASEIREMNASGRLALAYVFVKKMGSLKRAFRWFDTRRIGKIAQVVWDTGFTLLHIDSEKLCGWKPFEIFRQIDTDPCDGMISMKELGQSEWLDAAETIATEMEEKGMQDLQVSAKLRGHAMMHQAAKNRRSRKVMYEQDPWLLEMQERQAVKKQEEDFRRKVTDKLMALQERESFTFGREWLCHAEDQLNPVSRSWIVEEAPNGATREVSLDFALWFQGDEVGSGDAGSVMVVNCSEYADEIQEKLSAIPLHSNLLVSTDSYLDRSIVQLVAKRAFLVAVIEEVGTTEECVVYNVPSDFVEKIEIQLNGLCQDEGVFLSQGLTKEETQLARVLSENLGFLTTTNADGSLSDIPVGDEIRMAMGTRTEEQQYMIYRLVKELGLELQEEGQKKQREAIIGNMKGLIKELKNTLMAAQPGDVLKFMLPVRENQQQAFFSVAGDYGYEHLGELCSRPQALFLRYGDLKGFAEDLKYVTPNVDTKLYRFTGMFEYVFEDTLQLQIDMGVRVRHGLTFDWFQIFLQKIILRLGIQFVPVFDGAVRRVVLGEEADELWNTYRHMAMYEVNEQVVHEVNKWREKDVGPAEEGTGP